MIPSGLDPHIPVFVQHDAGISERHTDAYAVADGYTRDGEIRSRIALPTDKQTNKHMQLPVLSARNRSDIVRLPVNISQDSSVDSLPPGEIELTQQFPRNCATQQSSAHEEFGTLVASNSDSVSTSPSIIVRTDTPVSDTGRGANLPPDPSASNIATRVKRAESLIVPPVIYIQSATPTRPSNDLRLGQEVRRQPLRRVHHLYMDAVSATNGSCFQGILRWFYNI